MNGPTHEIQPPREPVWRPASARGAAETMMAQRGAGQVSVQGNEPDPSYLRLVELAWDIRQTARLKGMAERLSQTIVIVGSKPRLWINGAIRIEADPRHGLDQARYRALRQTSASSDAHGAQADDAQAAVSEILLADADRTTILDFVMARLMAQPGAPTFEGGEGI